MPAARPASRATRPPARSPRLAAVVAGAILCLGPATAPGQATVLTLHDAFARADAWAVGNRTARADRDAAAAQRLATARGILPTVRFEAGFVRTTDPVGAFGTTMRQQRLTAGDFDPARLNAPDPLGNYTGALVIEQPVIMADAWLARHAASRTARGADHAADWAFITTRADVVAAYFGGILAGERTLALDAAARAAHAHVEQAEHQLEAGFATRSDALLAAVRAADLDAALVEAQGDSALARRRLMAVLGDNLDPALSLPTRFPADSVSERLARDVLAMGVDERADVAGARAGVAATDADLARTRALLAPRIMSFARRDLNSPGHPFGGASSWTVGVVASWTPFSGAGEVAEQRAARARKMAAEARLDGAMTQAGVDLDRTTVALRTSLARLAIARQAVAQGAEAHRIVARKYEGGLATVVELLDASAAETQSRLALASARYALITATADRLRAIGADPARLTALEVAERRS